jgi:hypothetical protein
MNYFSNYKIISLGYNCFIKKYMIDIGISQETNLFDYIGTSMWTINKLFENDFKDLFNLEEYEKIKILVNDSTYNNVVVNKRYYIRFMHDFKNPSLPSINSKFSVLKNFNYDIMDDVKIKFKSFKETYERRINRLKKLLIDEKKILFIRFEEPMNNRIIYDEYKKNFERSELNNIIDYSTMLKINYKKLEFKIIYLSNTHETKYLKENNIIILNIGKEIIDSWGNCTSGFKNIFDKNKSLLISILI